MAQCLGLLILSHTSYHENQKTTLFPIIRGSELECEGAAMEVADGGPATRRAIVPSMAHIR